MNQALYAHMNNKRKMKKKKKEGNEHTKTAFSNPSDIVRSISFHPNLICICYINIFKGKIRN
jgi:hypothetical protein